VRIYLDVSCLNRPFDDQRQSRIRLEAEAVALVFQCIDRGAWTQVSSEIAIREIEAIPDGERRNRVRALLPAAPEMARLSDAAWSRAKELQELGFKSADVAHLAAAEENECDFFLSCDDRLCRTAKRHSKKMTIAVANPLDWLKRIEDADDAG